MKLRAMDGIRFILIHKTGVDLLRVYKVVGNDTIERAAFLEMIEFVRGAKSSRQYLTFCWDGDDLNDCWSGVEWRARKTFSLSVYEE